jgi:type IV secretion system protein VirB10
MTDVPEQQPAKAGDILAGQRAIGEGSGTRSKTIGKAPILIGGLLVTASALALIFALAGRSAPQGPNKSGEPSSASSISAAPDKLKIAALEGKPSSGQIGPGQTLKTSSGQSDGIETNSSSPEKSTGGIADPGSKPSANGVGGSSQTATPAPAAPVSPYQEQWAAHNQQLAEIKRARLERWQEGSTANSSVSIPRSGTVTAQSSQNISAERASYTPPAQSGLGGAGLPQDGDPNGQGGKRSFLAQPGQSSSYLSARREAPLSPYELKAGSVINGKLVTGINSDLPGQIIAIVDRNVFDTATGKYLLIPQGARLVGAYDSGVTYGQSRVLIAWRRIIYPDGSSIDIGSMPGTDRSGYAGLKDQVNNHYARTFGGAFMMSLFSAGIQLSQPQATNGENQTASQTITAALGQQMGQLGMELSRKNLQVQPTLQIRPGYKFDVVITKDMILKPWKAPQ